jgi:hypothetical protein
MTSRQAASSKRLWTTVGRGEGGRWQLARCERSTAEPASVGDGGVADGEWWIERQGARCFGLRMVDREAWLFMGWVCMGCRGEKHIRPWSARRARASVLSPFAARLLPPPLPLAASCTGRAQAPHFGLGPGTSNLSPNPIKLASCDAELPSAGRRHHLRDQPRPR